MEFPTNENSLSPVKALVRKMTKCLYNQELISSQLHSLEKSALRGQGISQGEPQLKPKIINPPSAFQKYLRSQHKTSGKIQIIDLPKQPFGVHSSYNQHSLFKKNHFIQKDSIFSQERQKNLQNLSRQYQLLQRRKKNPVSPKFKKQKWLSATDKLQIYPMNAGNLVCLKQKSLIKQYQKTKIPQKQQQDLKQTFRKIKHTNTFLHGKTRRMSIGGVQNRNLQERISVVQGNRRKSMSYYTSEQKERLGVPLTSDIRMNTQ